MVLRYFKKRRSQTPRLFKIYLSFRQLLTFIPLQMVIDEVLPIYSHGITFEQVFKVVLTVRSGQYRSAVQSCNIDDCTERCRTKVCNRRAWKGEVGVEDGKRVCVFGVWYIPSGSRSVNQQLLASPKLREVQSVTPHINAFVTKNKASCVILMTSNLFLGTPLYNCSTFI